MSKLNVSASKICFHASKPNSKVSYFSASASVSKTCELACPSLSSSASSSVFKHIKRFSVSVSFLYIYCDAFASQLGRVERGKYNIVSVGQEAR